MKYTILKCDACGKEYDPKEYAKELKAKNILKKCDFRINIFAKAEPGSMIEDCGMFDICPDCADKIIPLIMNNVLLIAQGAEK